MALYTYYQLCGCETYRPLGVPPSAAFGGGAIYTNDNLLLSLWNVTDFDDTGNIPIAGDLIKPFQFTQGGVDAFAQFKTEGCDLGQLYSNAYDDRYRCAFELADTQFVEDQTLGPNILAILKPPQGAVEKMLRIIKNVKIDPASFFGMEFVIRQSGAWAAIWNFLATNTHYSPIVAPEFMSCQFGGLVFTNLPLAITNGMDGNFPLFYQTSDINNGPVVGDELRKLVAGAPFYVPCLITRGTDLIGGTTRFYISWPHTII